MLGITLGDTVPSSGFDLHHATKGLQLFTDDAIHGIEEVSLDYVAAFAGLAPSTTDEAKALAAGLRAHVKKLLSTIGGECALEKPAFYMVFCSDA